MYQQQEQEQQQDVEKPFLDPLFSRIKIEYITTVLLTGWKYEVEGVEVDESLVPSDLVRVADAPAHGVEHGHDGAAAQSHNPRKQKHEEDHDEQDAG
jgi:ribosomal protein L12E/L44/L45/RPP1/RPP2